MITKQFAAQFIDYNPNTGIFTWKKGSRRPIGMKAGRVEKNGYVEIRIRGKRISAHRLAWLLIHDQVPSLEIDHINHNRSDNRITNLRLATHSQNQHNTQKPKHNTSGIKGVSWCNKKQKWLAQMAHKCKTYSLGLFEKKEEAAIVIREFRTKMVGPFAHH